jgi:hypothetical protein
VRRVVAFQFGIYDLTSDVFDKYNTGEGVPIGIIVDVINEALYYHGVTVSAVYGNIVDRESFSRHDLLRAP